MDGRRERMGPVIRKLDRRYFSTFPIGPDARRGEGAGTAASSVWQLRGGPRMGKNQPRPIPSAPLSSA
jgi:hypothetical protein